MLKVFISVVSCFTLAILWSLRKFRKHNLPGPPPLPLIGNCAILKPDGHEFYKQLLQWADKYSRESGFFAIWFGMHMRIIITGVDHAEKILASTSLITKSFQYRFLKPWIGDGLLNSSGTKWHERRKLLTPAFHFKILNIFRNSMNRHAAKLVDKLEKHKDTTFNIFPYIVLSALDIICENAMGVDMNALDNSESEYVRAVHKISPLLLSRSKRFWLWPELTFRLSPTGREHDKCIEILHSFTKKVIRERREMKKGSVIIDENTTKLAFLDLLLDAEESDKIDDEGIQEEVDTFMFEGHDTTSAAIAWSIYLIALHNDVQEKILNEITNVVGESQKDLNSSDLSQLKYLECVIKEALRLYPAVPSFSRRVTEPVNLGGYEIPVGATVNVLPMAIHRSEKHFKEANKFDPERWATKSDEIERNPFSFIPFSAGMRNCIGQKFAMMEMKIILVWLLRAFKISTKVEEKDFLPSSNLVLRPQNGVNIYLEERA